MNRNIEAIFLDVGNTMRKLVKSEPQQAYARQQLAALVGTQESPEAFCEMLAGRYKTYREWALANMAEAPEKELWTRFMLPDYPAEKIAPLANKLTLQWRAQNGRREARPDVKPTLVELHKRRYILGVLANTISETEIPAWLEADGLAPYFEAVVLSVLLGCRKPDPEIYLEAARRAGVEPSHCAYVGDNPSRDILGARLAGFGMAIILLEPTTLQKEPPSGRDKPDHIIRECGDLLNIFQWC